MAKLYYEAVVKICVEVDDDTDRDELEGALAERICELPDVEQGTVLVTDLQLTMKDAK